MKFEHLQAEKSSDYKHLCVLLKIFIFAVFDPKWRLLKERQKKPNIWNLLTFQLGFQLEAIQLQRNLKAEMQWWSFRDR